MLFPIGIFSVPPGD